MMKVFVCMMAIPAAAAWSKTCTIQQKSTMRFLDAYESGNDYQVVTRTGQNNDSQQWVLTWEGDAYRIQQKSTNRYLDGWNGYDYEVVTRTSQTDSSQRWSVDYIGGGDYVIQHQMNQRYLDAYTSGNDYKVVTRTKQSDDTQKWILNCYYESQSEMNSLEAVKSPVDTTASKTCTIQQRSTLRYLDAYESGNDYQVVTRTSQNNDSQKWVVTWEGGAYKIQQKSTKRYLDGWNGYDYEVVTRTSQTDSSQKWSIDYDYSSGDYVIQHQMNMRYLDAYTSGSDYKVVTRPKQENDTQRWILSCYYQSETSGLVAVV